MITSQKFTFALACLALLAIGASCQLFAQETLTALDAEAMEAVSPTIQTGTPIIEKLKQGGPVVAVQLVLSFIGVTYAIGSWLTIRPNRIAPEGVCGQALELWRNDQFDTLYRLGETQPSTLSRVISFIAKHRENSAAEINMTCGDIASREIAVYMSRAYPIAVIANMLPLLGLLGTVFGMIECFDTVALAGDMGDPTLLASGISQALVTTAVGLALAIPLLYVYHHFKGKCNGYAMRLEENVTDLTSAWLLKSSYKEKAS